MAGDIEIFKFVINPLEVENKRNIDDSRRNITKMSMYCSNFSYFVVA